MKLWDFFDEVYEGYISEFDMLNMIEDMTNQFDEVKLNLICKEFDFYFFMKQDEFLGSFSNEEIENKIHEIERSGKKLPVMSDKIYKLTYVSEYFKSKKKLNEKKHLTEERKKELEKRRGEFHSNWQEKKKITLDVKKMMDPHGFQFISLHRLKNLLVDLKRKHTDAIYKFDEPSQDSFSPFQRNYRSEKSDTSKFFETVSSGVLSKLDIQNRVQELTDNYDEDKLELICKEFDTYIFVKYDKWRDSYSEKDLKKRIENRQAEGKKLPVKGDEKNRGHLLYVQDYFFMTRYGKPLSDKEFERFLYGDLEEESKVIDDNVLLGGFYIKTGSRSLRDLRDILIELKRKHTDAVYRFDDKELQINNIHPIHWLNGEESLRLFLDSIKKHGLIENRETDKIIQEHFKVDGQKPTKEPQPIKWLINNNYLAYLMHRLAEEFIINIKGRKHELTASHFISSEDKPLNTNSLASQLSNLIKHGKSTDKNISALENIIQRVKS